MHINSVAFLVAICLTYFSIGSEAQGRIGENRTELFDRFGNATSERKGKEFGSDQYTYEKDGWMITVWLIGDTCHKIRYNSKKATRLTSEQIASLMESNSEGQKWIRDPAGLSIANVIMPSFTNHRFVRDDKKAACLHSSSSVEFTSALWENSLAKQKADATQERTAVPKF